jgi:hypothetical protein
VEDLMIISFVLQYDESKLGDVVQYLPNRTIRQIRERYKNYLQKDVDLSPFTKEEDYKLIQLVAEKGNRWTEISNSFPRRTDVKLKNRYALLKRRNFSMTYETDDIKAQDKEAIEPVEDLMSSNIYEQSNYSFNFPSEQDSFGEFEFTF